jgi:hypothetical protein
MSLKLLRRVVIRHAFFGFEQHNARPWRFPGTFEVCAYKTLNWSFANGQKIVHVMEERQQIGHDEALWYELVDAPAHARPLSIPASAIPSQQKGVPALHVP